MPFFWSAMHKSEFYAHLLLTRPHAFLLLSHLYFVSVKEQSKKFVYWPRELRTIGCRAVLTIEQIKRSLSVLEKQGYISIGRMPHLKPLVEITLLHAEFPHG